MSCATEAPRVSARAERVVLDLDSFEVPALATELSEAEVRALRADPDVEAVEEDAWASVDPIAGALLPRGREEAPWGVRAIDADRAWTTSFGAGMRVAILDTGIDRTHPDLVPNCRAGASFVPTEPDWADTHGHGTHCAGIAAAALNGGGVVGVAPAAELLAVKVLGADGGGQFGWVAAGVEWAVRAGAHVLSVSLGGASMPETVQRVFESAARAGVLIVAAAGNAGGPVAYPARLDACVAVSALDPALRLWAGSNRGPEIELAAPGADVLSTAPGAGYRRMSGTSMACPHVSGAAALAWATHRFADAERIRRLLRETARPLEGPREHFGAGMVHAFAAARAAR